MLRRVDSSLKVMKSVGQKGSRNLCRNAHSILLARLTPPRLNSSGCVATT